MALVLVCCDLVWFGLVWFGLVWRLVLWFVSLVLWFALIWCFGLSCLIVVLLRCHVVELFSRWVVGVVELFSC